LKGKYQNKLEVILKVPGAVMEDPADAPLVDWFFEKMRDNEYDQAIGRVLGERIWDMFLADVSNKTGQAQNSKPKKDWLTEYDRGENPGTV